MNKDVSKALDLMSALSKIHGTREVYNFACAAVETLGFLRWHSVQYGTAKPELGNYGIGNYTEVWCLTYITKRVYKTDPVARLVINCDTPLIWSNIIKKESDHEVLYDLLQNTDDRDGISFPVHGASGYKGYISFTSNEKIEIDADDLELLSMFATMIHRKLVKYCDNSQLIKKDIRPFSAREREILLLITEGKSNAEIGIILGISENTVKFHIKKICLEINVSTRIQAAIIALQRGLLAG